MAISQTALILAGGTAVLSIVFGIRVAIRAMAGGGEAAAAGGSGAPDVAGVIALPPLIFLGFLASAAVLEAVVPFPVLGAYAFARDLAGVALATAGFVMIVMGMRRFVPPRVRTSAREAQDDLCRHRCPQTHRTITQESSLGVATANATRRPRTEVAPVALTN